MGPAAVTDDDLIAWLAREDWAPNTRRCALASLRVFFGWLHATGRRDDNPAATLPNVRGIVGKPRPVPERALRLAVLAAGDRERLMLALGACAGLRRAEIATLRGDCLERDLEGWSLRIVGKGGRERIVPVSDDLAAMVEARGTGWTFPGQMRADGTPVRGDRAAGHLSPARVGELVSALLPDGWTTHTLRHRFASAAYRADRDIRAVQELLGHASVATTQVYTAIPDDARRRASTAAGIVGVA